MGDRQEYVALDWVNNELTETLKQAQQALAAFEEDPADHSRLQFCLTYLHQVRGTLEMVEVFGAALFASELEALTKHLVAHPERADNDTLSLLLQGILQLPAYLERLQRGGTDHPAVMASLIDDLRAARQSNPIDRSRLYAPNLDAVADEMKQTVDTATLTPEVRERLRRLRQLFQFALVGYLRGDQPEENLGYLRKASTRLSDQFQGAGSGLLWELAAAVFSAAQDRLLPTDTDLRPALLRLDRQLKQDLQATDRRESPTAPRALVQFLLYYVAEASPDTRTLADLHFRFNLQDTSLEDARVEAEREALRGPDRDTVSSVSQALIDELSDVKDELDLFARSGNETPANLGKLVAPLQQIHDTLGMLRVTQSQRVLAEQIEALGTLSRQSSVEAQSVLDVAGGLLYVESTLTGMHEGEAGKRRPRNDVSSAQKVLVAEVRNAIESCKEAIVAYIGAQWDTSKLTDVPGWLRQIEANLDMIPLSEPAAVIATIRSYMTRELLGDNARRHADWTNMDRLADALMGVDYYLERLPDEEDRPADDDILQRARDSLAALGYVVETEPAADGNDDPFPVSEDAISDTLDDYFEAVSDLDQEAIDTAWQSAEVDSGDAGTDGDGDSLAAAPGSEPAGNLSAAMDDEVMDDDVYDLSDEDVSLDDPDSFFTDSQLTLSDGSETDTDIARDRIAGETETPDTPPVDFESARSSDAVHTDNTDAKAAELPAADPPDTGASTEAGDDGDDLIDDDIRDIFLEEAEEVLAEINTCFPQYRADRENREALTDLRRAFHTLKGSGRMVKALVVGELAWSVENMLNRVLEGTITASDAMIDLLNDVINAIPELVDDFAQARGSDTQAVNALAARADALAKGELPPAVPSAPESEFESDDDTDSQPQDPDTMPTKAADDSESASADMPGAAASDQSDEQLFSIFQQEIRSHLETVHDYLKTRKNSKKPKVNDALQRALHTIKGSAHMAGINAMADMATPVEKLAKDLHSYQLPVSRTMREVLQQTADYAEQQLDELQAGQEATPAPDSFFQALKDIRAEIADATAGRGEDVSDNLMSIFLNEAMTTVLSAEDTLSAWQSSGIESGKLRSLRQDLITLADAARAIELLPLSSLANQLILLYEFLQQSPPDSAEHPAFDALYRAHEAIIDMMDRLAAGQSVQEQRALEQELAELAGVPVAGPFELEVDAENNALPSMSARTPDEPSTTTTDTETETDTEAEAEAKGRAQHSDAPGEPDISAQDDALPEDTSADPAPAPSEPNATDWFSLADTDPDILDIFLEEADELLATIAEELEQWHRTPADLTPVSALQRDLHTLKGGARMADATPVGDLAHELEFIYEALSNRQLEPSRDLLGHLQLAQDQVAQMVQDVGERHGCYTQNHMIAWLHSLRTGKPMPEQYRNDAESQDHMEQTALDAVETGQQFFTSAELNNLASDILEVFVDEAVELIDELDEAINQWRDRPSNELAADELKRVLHTLKGGARLARLPSLGTLSHELESYVVRAQQSRVPLDDQFFSQVLGQYDQLAAAIDQLQAIMKGDPPPAAGGAADENSNVVPFRKAAEETDSEQAAEPAAASQSGADGSARRPQPQETVKVNANLLEGLVNLAGESSISRARLEEQINELGFTLGDLDTTIERLRDKVRQLDLETEAQVLFRQERAEESNYEDFDPLEMDRYSQIQQLSRSLMETSSDLLDLRNTLGNKSRDAETVLLQQSRIHSDLQEGLMQTRMVPFSRLAPRLRRIVRQVCNELDKAARFDINNAEGEMDRSVLERMVSPLEHMLRNAVDHGLESPDEREAAGKAREGQITLSLQRQGGNIVLTLDDDGKGIDVQGVRRKAIERNLMQEDEPLSDQEVLQFIFSAGFSTAASVTQLSGRGVGMDVVANEVKALGGSMDIATRPGQGSTFTVSLPFTVSVNRALMVGTGDDIYAIPLNTIDGVARVQPTALQEHLGEASTPFVYGGQTYRVQSLSRLIGASHERHLEELTTPQPLILVKSLDRQTPLALHVDRLMGSREVVVKTLGPQFTSVPSVSGATILGDGSVVVILDLPAMLRSERVTQQIIAPETDTLPSPDAPEQAPAQSKVTPIRQRDTEERPLEVMVVDDSVTVRKVTGRLLERQGMRVLTAKDGMDAMAQLQDHEPDIILLDIEMPRMDGFEVANRVRHTERLSEIPIIMITSRTGEKHKEHAMEIGVNEYMGKPFQEGTLLEAIARLVKQ